ncbi:MAG: hypothetical protein WA666_05000 [Nitrospirota bacterium]
MPGKMVLLALGFLLLFAGEAYCGNAFIIELKNGNCINADSCRVEGKKLVLSYPLGKAAITLGSVERILISGPEQGGLFQEKGHESYGHLMPVKQPDESAGSAADSEPVELWNAGEKEMAKERLIEKLAEAEANGQTFDNNGEDRLLSEFSQDGGNEMH